MSKIPRRGPLDDSVKLGIPNVTTDPESLRRATEALTRAIEELARQRGDVGRSAVRVNDLIKLGIISPDIVHTLDPGGAKYLQRGPAGMDPQQPPGMGPGEPGEPGEPVEPPGPPDWNEIINLPDCFPPCGHDHTWDEITTLPECFPPCDHTHPWDDITEIPENIEQLAVLDCCGPIVLECLSGGEGAPIRPPISDLPNVLVSANITGTAARSIWYQESQDRIWQGAGGLRFVDPETLGTTTPSISPRPAWRTIAVQDATIWVASDAGTGEGYRLDPNTGEVLQTVGSNFDTRPQFIDSGEFVTVYYTGAQNNTRYRVRAAANASVITTQTFVPQMRAEIAIGDGLLWAMRELGSLSFYIINPKVSPAGGGIVSETFIGTSGTDGGQFHEAAVAFDRTRRRIYAVRRAGNGFPARLYRHDLDTDTVTVATEITGINNSATMLLGWVPSLRAIVLIAANTPPTNALRIILFDDETNEVFYSQQDTRTIINSNLVQSNASENVSFDKDGYFYWHHGNLVHRIDFREFIPNVPQLPGGSIFRCYEIEVSERLSIENPRAQDGQNPFLDLALVEQAEGGTAQAFTVDDWGRVIETRPFAPEDFPDFGQPIEDDAVYQFFLADSMPYKQFEYDAGLLDIINLYDDAGLTNLRYSKQLVRTGDKLTSIVLTRYPDEAQWTKTLSYNLDEALETVATEAA